MRTTLLLAVTGGLAYGQTVAKQEFEVAPIKPSTPPRASRLPAQAASIQQAALTHPHF